MRRVQPGGVRMPDEGPNQRITPHAGVPQRPASAAALGGWGRGWVGLVGGVLSRFCRTHGTHRLDFVLACGRVSVVLLPPFGLLCVVLPAARCFQGCAFLGRAPSVAPSPPFWLRGLACGLFLLGLARGSVGGGGCCAGGLALHPVFFTAAWLAALVRGGTAGPSSLLGPDNGSNVPGLEAVSLLAAGL